MTFHNVTLCTSEVAKQSIVFSPASPCVCLSAQQLKYYWSEADAAC